MPVTFVCSIRLNRLQRILGRHTRQYLIHVSLQKLAGGNYHARKAKGTYAQVQIRVFLRRGVSLVNIFL